MFAVVVVAILASTAIGAVPPPAGTPVGESPAPSGVIASGESGAPAPTPVVDPAVVDLLAKLNDQLGGAGNALEAERARVNFRVEEVVDWIRQINGLASTSADVVTALKGAFGPNQAGGRLSTLYGLILDSANETLDASIRNEPEYRVGAAELVALIAQLPALQAELDMLAIPPSPSAPPPSSAPPSATPSLSSATPSASAPSPTRGASSTPASPAASSPSPNELIVNGGFENGVGQPWGLYLGGDAIANVAQDPSTPWAGKAAARIDIASGSPAYSGISLRQDGLLLDAGRPYVLNLAVRAAGPREVRVRIASKAGAAYVTRRVLATSDWTIVSVVFVSNYADLDAVLELDMGRADSTTWWDSVSLHPVGG